MSDLVTAGTEVMRPMSLDLVNSALPIELMLKLVDKVREVRSQVMQKGRHYGPIGNSNKDCLLQPGADVLAMTFRLVPKFDLIEHIYTEDEVSYVVKCRLEHVITKEVYGELMGSASSRESKFERQIRTRGVGPKDVDNNLLKIAQKRAKVGCVNCTTGASEMFTVDLEDEEEQIITKNLPDPTKATAKVERTRVTHQGTVPKPPPQPPPPPQNPRHELVNLMSDYTELGGNVGEVIDPAVDLADLPDGEVRRASSMLRVRIAGKRAVEREAQ